MSVITAVCVRQVRMPLIEPYWSMISCIDSLDTMIAEVHLDDGSTGYGEAAIYTGYTHESPEGGWRFCTEFGVDLLGLGAQAALSRLAEFRESDPHAVSCLAGAIEMAMGEPLLQPHSQSRAFPLLAPVSSRAPERIAGEIERLLNEGYRTLKVKVGQDVDADLRRVRVIQSAVAGRARLRLDANQGFSCDDACRFAAGLDPAGIELFEQPCHEGDWDAALKVRDTSNVPMMLDESIYGEREIDRAARLRAAGFIKLKLVKLGGVRWLRQGLERVRAQRMTPIVGNGVATEIGCWMEACAAWGVVDAAGEMNGYLKPRDRLLLNPLPFEDGCLVIPAGWTPEVDPVSLDRFTTRSHVARA